MPISVKVSMGWHRGNSRNLGNAGDGNGKEKNYLLKKKLIYTEGWLGNGTKACSGEAGI